MEIDLILLILCSFRKLMLIPLLEIFIFINEKVPMIVQLVLKWIDAVITIVIKVMITVAAAIITTTITTATTIKQG